MNSEKKSIIEHKMRVLIFFTRYYHECIPVLLGKKLLLLAA